MTVASGQWLVFSVQWLVWKQSKVQSRKNTKDTKNTLAFCLLPHPSGPSKVDTDQM